jgi:AcrR family transcriptional regulator
MGIDNNISNIYNVYASNYLHALNMRAMIMLNKPHNGQGVTDKQDAEIRADETRQCILEAAFEVFARQGYVRATTRSLAAAAGVNEVTLFRHFGNKKKLFSAVVERFGGAAVAGELDKYITGDYRRDTLAIGRALNRIMLQRKDVIRLAISEADHFPEVQEELAQNPHHLRRMLASYFARQIDAGQCRALNPGAMAQAFMGMFLTYMITQGIFNDPVELEIQTDDVVAQFVDIFVEGTINRH